MTLSQKAREELHWWVQNVTSAFRNIMPTDPDLILTTDASNTGWGAVQGDPKNWWIMGPGRTSIPYQLLRTESSFAGFEIRVLLFITSTFEYSLIIPLQLHMSVPREVLNQLTVMIWLSKFGSGVEKERFTVA